MATATVTFQSAKQAFVGLYGNTIYSQEFASFDEAFRAAWDSFDYITNAATPEGVAQGMTECWQLTEN